MRTLLYIIIALPLAILGLVGAVVALIALSLCRAARARTSSGPTS
jgi:hypothetical protein